MVNPYLNSLGDTEESFNFYQSVFGRDENDEDKIIHVALPLGRGNMLMGTDSKEEADKLFKELSDGGKISMPIGDTFWGSYCGMTTDKFGVNWMVSYTYPKPNQK